MKKRIVTMLLSLGMFLTCFPGLSACAVTEAGGAPSAASVGDSATDELRGVWVATAYNIDFPSKPGLSVAALKAELDDIVNETAAMGLNAIFFQARPFGDALYNSKLFPWAQCLTGTQGKAPEDGFDPLAYITEKAHEAGLQLHAWLNPFRVSSSQEPSALSENNPARLHPDWVTKPSNGTLWYDPGLPEVRQLIADGVAEILRNYPVDGIHFDDYFYPDAKTFPDDASFKKYGQKYTNRDDWRRDNVTAMVTLVQKTVRETKSTAAFGISPFGIWANKGQNAQGSDTTGNSSYYSHFADTRKWVKTNLVDYIAPQLYWAIGFSVADYKVLLDWWTNVCAGTKVQLYVGLAGYRVGDGKAGDSWFTVRPIVDQLELNKSYKDLGGVIYFSYSDFFSAPTLLQTVKSRYNPAEGGAAFEQPMPLFEEYSKLSVSRPAANITTTEDGYYLMGTSEPKQSLTLNGKAVEGRGTRGTFGVYCKLSMGKNSFTLAQGDKSVTRDITRTSPGGSAGPSELSKAEVSAVYPRVDEYSGDKTSVSLSCVAPIGATVTCKIGGQMVTLTPSAKTAPGGGKIYGTTYSGSFKTTIPESVKDTVYDFGQPVYTMTYNGKSHSQTAAGHVYGVRTGAALLGTVSAEMAYLYEAVSDPSIATVYKNQTFAFNCVTQNGKWVRLTSGLWVDGSQVSLSRQKINGKVSSASYQITEEYDRIIFDTENALASLVRLSGDKLTVKLYSASSAPAIKVPAGALVSKAEGTMEGTTTASYTLTLSEGLEGYWTTAENGDTVLYLKRKPKLSEGPKPLRGITIMVDPGHGNSDPGTYGALGLNYTEKDVTLASAKKLAALLTQMGAEVILTRTGDSTVSLQDRVSQSWQKRPDLFVSIHNNDMGNNYDCSKIAGISVWYRNEVGKTFNQHMYNYLYAALERGKKGANQANFYVCRPEWAPSVIIETAFMSHPQEFEWLIDNAEQDRLVAAIAEGIVRYYR